MFRVFGQVNRRGKVASSIGYGCVADEWAAYTDSSRRSKQLSCTKYFHPNYGLIYMIFQSFNDFLEFLKLFNSNNKQNKVLSPRAEIARVYDSGPGGRVSMHTQQLTSQH